MAGDGNPDAEMGKDESANFLSYVIANFFCIFSTGR